MDTFIHQETVKRLQREAVSFLTHKELRIRGKSVAPKEIEVYYYEDNGDFKDTSVHRNILQRNNPNRFYIHRRGLMDTDKYKGGNRAGIDFVISDDKSIYYSYLIRSAVIDGQLKIGPNNVLKYLTEVTKCSYEEIESSPVEMVSLNSEGDVLFSKRINLGKNVGEFEGYELRAVLCDSLFRNNKYPQKESMIVGFLLKRAILGMPKEEVLKYAQENLGYVPSCLKSL